MNKLDGIIARALDYDLTWCENSVAERYYCDWRVDPCLVVVYATKVPHRLYIKDESTGTENFYQAINGEALLIPAGFRHRFESEAGEIRGVNIQFNLFGTSDVLSFFKVPHYLSSRKAKRIGEIIASLVKTIGRRSQLTLTEQDENNDIVDISTIIKERSLVLALLSSILDHSIEKPEGGVRLILLQKIRPALEYIDENLTRKLTIKKLADLCHLSTHRFSNAFKESIGQPPHRYILSRKIEKAMAMLIYTNYSIAFIASTLGFHDQPHFTKQFKISTGLSPNYYRKDARRNV